MEQDLACCLDICRILGDLIGNILPEYHLIQTEDGIYRGPYFMAHVGKEKILGFADAFDLFGFLSCLPVFPRILPVLKPDHDIDGDPDIYSRYGGILDSHHYGVRMDKLRKPPGRIKYKRSKQCQKNQKYQPPYPRDHKPYKEVGECKPVNSSAVKATSVKKSQREQDANDPCTYDLRSQLRSVPSDACK